MADLKTVFMGMELKNPIVIASSPLTANIENLIKCEKAGAGAVVLKSIFEEQINAEADLATMENSDYLQQSDFTEVFGNLSKDYFIDQYVNLISQAKKELSIPVIASINCSHVSTWERYAKRFKACGADALELNYYPIASKASVTGASVDRAALDFAHEARRAVDLPISLKIGNEYSSLANMIRGFAKEGMDSLTLFNNFFHPDIDIEKLEVCGARSFAGGNSYYETLRWIALMAAEVKDVDFAASKGISDGQTAVKMLLAGARVVEICSTIFKNGYEAVGQMLDYISSWMDKKGFKSISDFQGRLAQENMADGAVWERTQYMKNLTSL